MGVTRIRYSTNNIGIWESIANGRCDSKMYNDNMRTTKCGRWMEGD